MSDEISIDDDNDEVLNRVVGRTIVAITRTKSTGRDWQMGENSVEIVLDDGSKLLFEGDGFDASRLLTTYQPTANRTGGDCDVCGETMHGLVIFELGAMSGHKVCLGERATIVGQYL